jgi:prepilin-type N-terminal cleavage/methylation domain-containing protein
MRGIIVAATRRARRSEGFTLIEVLVAMTILGIVLTALVSSFTTGMRNEIDQSRRELAYANARLAIQRMRVDIHCAGGVTSVDQNAYGGFTLTLTESNDQSPGGWCPGVIPPGDDSSGVQWCTVPYSGSSTRFVLYRYLGTDPSECGGGTGSSFEVDYVAVPPTGWPTNSDTTSAPTSWVGNVWPTAQACTSGELPTVAIDINVAPDQINYPNEHYELQTIGTLRNANRC